jgi:hypothetical protein
VHEIIVHEIPNTIRSTYMAHERTLLATLSCFIIMHVVVPISRSFIAGFLERATYLPMKLPRVVHIIALIISYIYRINLANNQ